METFNAGKLGNFFNKLGNQIKDIAEDLGDEILDGLQDAGGFVGKLVSKGEDIVDTADDFVNKNLINEVKNFQQNSKLSEGLLVLLQNLLKN